MGNLTEILIETAAFAAVTGPLVHTLATAAYYPKRDIKGIKVPFCERLRYRGYIWDSVKFTAAASVCHSLYYTYVHDLVSRLF